ncbi:EAL domain-containing protein [Aquabacter spiritensis]|uniref:EAL domain-containing protein (Putative c-di-GMP-specific phosphodiesterase class I) n=1 Tax=Aquabacter spiritensis TaxID=933073 RepID=A0A4R3M3S5_9HYPH|nr:EAL domain-containing response regulator [Aquabacter spiritensis]TCT07911.1 EAL domain-containing protein (putative c-di-GMP-specific phosphodiesterase class I) [Aquabacter spiritensis]
MPRRRKILILDDDAAFCEDLAEALTAAGHQVVTAGDARSLAETDLSDHDLLLLDLALPAMDGISFLSRIAEARHPPQLVFISGSGEELLRAAASIGGSHGLDVLGSLQKPFAPELVLDLATRAAPPAGPPAAAPSHSSAALLPVLQGAIHGRSLPVLFQPLVTADTLVFVGAEALLGNLLAGYGAVRPQDLIAGAAAHPTLLVDLSLHVLRKAAEACAHWTGLGQTGRVSVNMPLDVLLSEDCVAVISSVVTRAGVAPASVVLELTEDALYDSSPRALAALARLRLAGFGLALDDVGQRQSGLLQLANLPVTEIKIDLELMRQAREWEKPRSIFASIADLGHRLGMKVVAEGVETQADLALARAHGIDYIQGHLVSRKRPLQELLAMLPNASASWNTLHSGTA